MFDRTVRTCVETGAAFYAFTDIGDDCFVIFEFDDFHGAGLNTFTRARAFIVAYLDHDIPMLEDLLHNGHPWFISNSFYINCCNVNRIPTELSLQTLIFPIEIP